jgi:hypothetical protein
VTLSSEFSVTAGPLAVGLIEPPLSIRRSSFAVDVCTGAVVAVEINVSASAPFGATTGIKAARKANGLSAPRIETSLLRRAARSGAPAIPH